MDMVQKKADALAFLKANITGVLATASRGHKPHASVVYYTCDDSFSVYFATRFGSRKHQAMREHPDVAFVVGIEETPQTIQIEGVAEEIVDADEKLRILPGLIRALTSNENYFAPITKLDQSEIVVMWIKPNWVRWGDYAVASDGTDNVLFEIPLP
jgi:nitroimidazol reductase NimA-like FMN-containing flavoprotein (pyridoxamine 5'-phosphate oxidase superfamily)